MKTDFEIKVPGTQFVIKSNTLYTVLPKPDPNAPDGFKEHGTTKIIHPEVGNVVSAPFDIAMGVWDTGFYDYSPCLKNLDEKEAEKFVKQVNEVIVKPVEKIKGEGVLDHKASNKFFDDFVISLYNKVAFNTADPLQLLGLYLAILGKELCPREHLGSPEFRDAAFQVVNKEKEFNAKEEIKINNTKAIGKFYTLLNSDKKKLDIILKYLGISSTVIQDENTFISVFTRFLEDKQDGYRNSKIFIDTLDKFSSKEGEEELYIYQTLHELYDKKILKLHKQEYFLREHNLGNSIKHAATYAAAKPEIKRMIAELSADEEEDIEE